MTSTIEELTAKFLQTCDEAGESEQRVIERLTKRLHISRNTYQNFDETLTAGQRTADRITVFGSSWTFIRVFLAVLFFWMALDPIVCTN